MHAPGYSNNNPTVAAREPGADRWIGTSGLGREKRLLFMVGFSRDASEQEGTMRSGAIASLSTAREMVLIKERRCRRKENHFLRELTLGNAVCVASLLCQMNSCGPYVDVM